MNYLFLFLILTLSLFTNEVNKKSEELCNCLKLAKKTDNSTDKKKCLNLREKHVKDLGKGSNSYLNYIQNLEKCESELSGSKESTANTYEDKVKEVCDCFKTNKAKFQCFKLQSENSKNLPDSSKKTDFIKETNACAN